VPQHQALAGPDQLEIISFPFIVLLWALAAVAIGVTVYITWKHRRWLRCTSLVVASLVISLVATADTVNAHYAYLPTIGDVRQSLTGDRQWRNVEALGHLSGRDLRRATATGLTVRLRLPADPANGFAATTNVAYLPPQYFTNPGARFPVVYLFHGTPGKAADWFHGGQAASEGQAVAKAGHPAILVAAQMSRDWTDDPECVDGAVEKVESHLLTRVIPAVDTALRTRPDRSARTFAGISAGGYCALNLGLRNRAVAATIIDMSGETAPTHTGGATVLFGRNNPVAPQLIAENSPAHYGPNLPAGPATRIWFDSGTSDKSIMRQMSDLAHTLEAKGMDVCWRIRPGGHNYRVWTAALYEALPWALGSNAAPKHHRSRPGP
jgi:enterochelin esterase-like enzyme